MHRVIAIILCAFAALRLACSLSLAPKVLATDDDRRPGAWNGATSEADSDEKPNRWQKQDSNATVEEAANHWHKLK